MNRPTRSVVPARERRALVCLLGLAALAAACVPKPTGKPTAPSPEYEPPRAWASPSGAASSKSKDLPLD